jgi:anthranilate synthase component II
MTRVVLVDHYDSYTHNLAHLIASVTGTLPALVEHDAVDVEQLLDGSYTHVVLSPGPGHPEQPADFAVGDAVFRAGLLPVLGVCLGMQGLVTCYGGRVEPVEPAHGEVSRLVHSGRGLFEGVPQDLPVVRYHSLAATAVPDELVVTARSEDGVVMAVGHRSLPQAGVQFHPESVLTEHGRTLIANFLADNSVGVGP